MDYRDTSKTKSRSGRESDSGSDLDWEPEWEPDLDRKPVLEERPVERFFAKKSIPPKPKFRPKGKPEDVDEEEGRGRSRTKKPALVTGKKAKLREREIEEEEDRPEPEATRKRKRPEESPESTREEAAAKFRWRRNTTERDFIMKWALNKFPPREGAKSAYGVGILGDHIYLSRTGGVKGPKLKAIEEDFKKIPGANKPSWASNGVTLCDKFEGTDPTSQHAEAIILHQHFQDRSLKTPKPGEKIKGIIYSNMYPCPDCFTLLEEHGLEHDPMMNTEPNTAWKHPWPGGEIYQIYSKQYGEPSKIGFNSTYMKWRLSDEVTESLDTPDAAAGVTWEAYRQMRRRVSAKAKKSAPKAQETRRENKKKKEAEESKKRK
ncbi:hypothetical protein [Cryptosporangium sp. NPDC051539]|uniref:hypothetical protein n=1 Tax=Cryptosporangium sp. NPDC051539 TaxID=3363962 RepID=UPI00379844A9